VADKAATVAAMIAERRYESVHTLLLGTPLWFPDREQLLTEAVHNIRAADQLYQQARQPDIGTEGRAALLARALDICADHRNAIQELAKIPPPPPLNLRAVPSESGEMVRLTWQLPPADQVTFIVVRRAGSRPPVSSRSSSSGIHPATPAPAPAYAPGPPRPPPRLPSRRS
jgi:hypothetical protein